MLYEELTGQIIGICFDVMHELGAGFLEAVYENALAIALREKGLQVQTQVPLAVLFHRQNVGSFYADMLVDGKIMVELKAFAELTGVHEAQVINYLKATGIRVALLVNFGQPRVTWKRLDNKFIAERGNNKD